MNILIPIGGIGKRFSDEGYHSPKPLIKVLGVPMIQKVIASIKTEDQDLIHIIYNPELNPWRFKELLVKEFPERKFRFVELEKQTRGAAETIFLGIKDLEKQKLEENFLILDCDTFYSDDIVGRFRESANKNVIFYFEDLDEKPIFSYINFDKNQKVFQIREKEKISNNANSGAYGFRTGEVLKSYCENILSSSGELYVSRVYEKMISSGEETFAKKIENFDCVGTPLQLKIYCEKNHPDSQIRFCFDLDNTLVSFPSIKDDYSSVSPLQKNIDYLKFLKSQGGYIIIHTARRMKTHKGNIGAIVADVGKITLETLEKFDIPFDELFFGKPHAHFYIDDLGVSAFGQLDKEIGFYKTQSEARSFNSVRFTKNQVIKNSANNGEIFWYQNIPEKLKYICPIIFESDLASGYLKMEKIEGINFSYLYTNEALAPSDLAELMSVLETFHNFEDCEIPSEDFVGNYSEKISQRYAGNKEMYNLFGESEHILSKLLDSFETYALEKKKCCIIHGDPVFSNVIMSDKGLRLIDPRGKIGSKLTIFGDRRYDLAKIYQSVLGYDFILNDKEFNFKYIEEMKSAFESMVSDYDLKWIKVITASMFFSLMPLHDFSEKKFAKYISIIKSLLA